MPQFKQVTLNGPDHRKVEINVDRVFYFQRSAKDEFTYVYFAGDVSVSIVETPDQVLMATALRQAGASASG